MENAKALLAAERHVHRLLGVAIFATLVLVGTVERDRRSLSPMAGKRPAATAFSAFTTGRRPSAAIGDGGDGVGTGAFGSAAQAGAGPRQPRFAGALPPGFRAGAAAIGNGGGNTTLASLGSTAPDLGTLQPAPASVDQPVVADRSLTPRGFLSPAISPVAAEPVAAVGAVPEPASWLVMMLGLGGIVALYRRRSRTAATAP